MAKFGVDANSENHPRPNAGCLPNLPRSSTAATTNALIRSIDGGRWADRGRLSNLEPKFTCQAWAIVAQTLGPYSKSKGPRQATPPIVTELSCSKWRGGCGMLEEKFRAERASLLRNLASQADPFIKRRLLDLAKRYEGLARRRTPLTPVDLQIRDQISQSTER